MGLTRREFVATAAFASAARDPGAPRPLKEKAPREVAPYPPQEVRLLDSPFRRAMERNREFLHRLEADRLLHTFRVNAGLPSAAEPLGGWERPDCELRGHFLGHYLSACALMHAGDGDDVLKARGRALVAELAKCQKANGGGYLSAFPTEFFDRLRDGKRVWAPFYTIHKLMAGLLDMYKRCDDRQALEVAEGMARWTAAWVKPLSHEHMARVRTVEYGGMNEVLYDLYSVTRKELYAETAHRFDDAKLFDPLLEGRDELKGLHVNTQIPKILGALRRYEITGDQRYWRIAFIFWRQATGPRAYCTGGAGNFEHWRTEPGRLASELSSQTQECCCTYNLLKLTLRLFALGMGGWYMDYYERALFNGVLGVMNPEDGMTMYHVPLAPGYWKLFSTPHHSFWCCTGAAIESFSKLADGVYYCRDANASVVTEIFVNLFIPSEIRRPETLLRIWQETAFPDQAGTTLHIETAFLRRITFHIRIPLWARSFSVKVNGTPWPEPAFVKDYFTIDRMWLNGDTIEVSAEMGLRPHLMPDDPTLQAFLYGPIVLAGELGAEGLTREMQYGGLDGRHTLAGDPVPAPEFEAVRGLSFWIKPVPGRPATFRTVDQARNVTLVPLNRLFGQRYAVYWRVRSPKLES